MRTLSAVAVALLLGWAASVLFGAEPVDHVSFRDHYVVCAACQAHPPAWAHTVLR